MSDSKDTLNQTFNDRYEIRQKLGTGGMARVYLGYDTNLGREVAIKILHDHLADDAMFKERFEREARFVATLNHPNIVQVYDYATAQRGEESVCYMVMSLVQGKSLKDLLEEYEKKEERLSHIHIMGIMTDLCSALAYAHEKGMVHRDVKPANIILTDENRAILTDFGIARMIQGTQFTQEGITVGTPAYMSPEQATGAQVDNRSDVYALGIILYEMLVGHPPFADDGTLSVLLKHITEPVPPLSNYDFIDNPKLDSIVLKALAKNPDTRYQTAQSFLDDLKRAFAGETTEAEKIMSAPTVQLEIIHPPKLIKFSSASKGVLVIVGIGITLMLAIVLVGIMTRPSAPTPNSAIIIEIPRYFSTTFANDDADAQRFPQGSSAGLTRRIDIEGYRITNSRPSRAIATIYESAIPYSDFVIQMEAQLISGSSPASGYGIIFHYQDEENYNVFAVDGLGRYSIWVLENRVWRELRNANEEWSINEAILTSGQYNSLEIEVFQNSLTGYVNGIAVVTIENDTFVTGKIGIYVASTADGNTDVLIKSYQVMEATSAMTDSMTGVESMTDVDSMTGAESMTGEEITPDAP